MRKLWWEQWSGRLEMELKALDDSNISYQLDEDCFQKGLLKIQLQPTVNGETLELVAHYPELYPYFRFQVFAANLDLPRHQDPFQGTLCLIGRSTWNWHTTDTLASYITNPKRMSALLTSARSENREAVSHLEESQAEPFSDYYIYVQDSMLLVDSNWHLPPDILHGELEIALETDENRGLRGIVKTVRGPDKTVLAEADESIKSYYNQKIRGRWLRVSAPLKAPDGPNLWDQVIRLMPLMHKSFGRRIGSWKTDIIGIIFPEELRKGVTGDGWVFVVRRERHKRPRQKFTYAIRAGRYGRKDLEARIPELKALPKKRVAVFGLGGIGGPAVIEFARAGIGELRLIDYDFVDPGTGVRWPLGLSAVGLSKTMVLSKFIGREYPLTKILAFNHRIGNVNSGPVFENPSDLDVLDEMLDSVDLVIDATAEPGVHHMLGDFSWERGIPFLIAHTTPGATGGLVARFDPQRPSGRWCCLQRALYVDKTIPEPPFNESGNIQPLGCSDPTFTGAGFDVVEVTLETIRMAIGTLSVGPDGGYPASPWDVSILSLKDNSGNRIPPQWKPYELPPNLECSCVRNQSTFG